MAKQNISLYLHDQLITYLNLHQPSKLVNGLVAYSALANLGEQFTFLGEQFNSIEPKDLSLMSVAPIPKLDRSQSGFRINVGKATPSHRARAKVIARMFETQPAIDQLEMVADYLASCYD